MRHLIRTALTVAAACAASALAASGASASSALRAVGATASVPRTAHLLGPLSQHAELRATVALNPRNPGALSAYATAVSTPGSTEYGRYLTVRQFAQRFGATPGSIAAVRAELRKAGLRIFQPTTCLCGSRGTSDRSSAPSTRNWRPCGCPAGASPT